MHVPGINAVPSKLEGDLFWPSQKLSNGLELPVRHITAWLAAAKARNLGAVIGALKHLGTRFEVGIQEVVKNSGVEEGAAQGNFSSCESLFALITG